MTQEKIQFHLPASWLPYLGDELNGKYMMTLLNFLQSEKELDKIIYPAAENIFAAFDHVDFSKVKIVILGQDPYHGEYKGIAQAHGLCFSVQFGVKPPPSLMNIFKELRADCGIQIPQQGCLTKWADQGVLLLNNVLTVEQGKADSHKGKGWEQFTDKVILALNEHREHIVFLLWGSYAQKKGQIINRDKHLVLEAPHPSPLSSYRGFFGCRHFSKANQYLQDNGLAAIDWQL